MAQSELASSTTQYEVLGTDGGHVEMYEDEQRTEAVEHAERLGAGAAVVELVTDVTETWRTLHEVKKEATPA